MRTPGWLKMRTPSFVYQNDTKEFDSLNKVIKFTSGFYLLLGI